MEATETQLTIGIEEEYQIVDHDGNLQSHIGALLAVATPVLGEQVKAEMMQSVVEIGTTICSDVSQARGELVRLRGTLASLLAPDELHIVCAGTHPWAHWQDQRITEHERYMTLQEDLQDVIRQLLIFGLHVHVGIPDKDRRIEVMNEARYFLPHLLALSTSSPFWLKRKTGLKSYRSVIWSRIPRTGIPPDFNSYDEYENYVELLVKTRSIDDGKKVWWDLRAHPFYPTIEFRVCDMPTKIDEAVCIAALIQAICAKLIKLRERNLGFRKYLPNLIAENKWRAMRHGIDGNLIDFGRQAEVPMRVLAGELMDFVDDVVDELGSRQDVAYVNTILEEGTSADRQLRMYEESDGDLGKVVYALGEESVMGVPVETLTAPAPEVL
ncbi:MAG: carboxylate-amine ligase [Candidatus Dormibacteraeota bacterium]|nr:carboxylate-amine ligase [Candidatus Dormibacteraeota bacterium]